MINYTIEKTAVKINLVVPLKDMRLIGGILDGVANSESDDYKYVDAANENALYSDAHKVGDLRDVSNRWDFIIREAAKPQKTV